MPDSGVAIPNPPVGVFRADAYQAYQPGPAWLTDPAVRGTIPRDPKGILVVGLTATGDVLHFLPIAVALKRAFPRARLGWVVQDKAKVILEGCAEIDQVHVFERQHWARGLASPVRFISTLREILSSKRALASGGYDLLVDPQGTVKSAMINAGSGVAARVGFSRGFCREMNFLSTTVHVALPTVRMHRVRKSLALLEAIGIDTSEHAVTYRVPSAAQAAADRTLEGDGLSGRGFVVIHPGTSAFGARKRWPPARFGELADRLHADFGLTPVFVLGPVESAWAESLVESVKSAPRKVIYPTSLSHLAGLLARARCFVGCDSAPLHLASNLRTPVVGLYGPTDPVLFAPYYRPAVVVVKGFECPRCGARHCNHRVPRMEAITVDEVFSGVRLLLDGIART